MNYEIKTNYRFNGDLTDKKFNSVILSVMNYAEKQALRINQKIVFKQYNEYKEARENINHYLQNDLIFCSTSKWILVSCTIDMISCMPTPNIRKKVLNYLNSQITSYCYSERPYTNQIRGYPYKSKNIVDLLEEVERVRQTRLNAGLSRQHYNGI